MANVVNQRDALLQASNARIVDVELKPNILQAVRGIRLSASGSIFKASAGGIYAPAELTVQASLLAFSGQPTLTWMVSPEGSATLTGSDYGVRTLKFLDMAQNSCVVRVEVSDGVTTYSDQVAITKVWEGPLDKDFTPPPTPLGFSTSSALSSFFVTHTDPSYQQGHGHLRTRVYGKIVQPGDPLPTFSDAVEIAQFTGNIYAHSSNPSTTWRLWIKWETVDGVLSENPAGGVNGLEAVTGQDVDLLLDTLSGQMTESQLSASMGARINLIDGNAPGSVNERIKSQVSGLVDALEAESSARVLAGILIEDQVELVQTTLSADLTAVRDVLEREVAERVAADLANTNAIDLAAASLESSLAAEVSARELAGSALAAAQETTGLQLDTLAADVAQEVESRATGDTALATAASTLTASQAGTAAALRVELETRATLDESLSTQTTTLAAVAGANSAALIVEQQSRSDADSAVSSQVTDLAAAVGTNAAALKVEQEVRSGADGALSGQTLTIAAETVGNSAALAVEQQARADANSAQALQITSLAAEVGLNAGLIQVEQQVRADAVSAAATQIATVSAATDTTAAALKLEQQTRADADGSQAGQLSVIAAATDLNLAAIKSEQDVRTDGDSATASQVTTIGSAVGSALSGVISEQAARADADSASASALNGLVADVGSALAGIKTEQSVRAASDEAAATQATVIAATLGANTSAITQEQAARSTDTGALASQVTTLGVSLDGKASVGAVSSLQTQVETIDGVVVAQGQQLSQLVAEQKAGTAALRAAIEVEELVRTSETEAITKQTAKLEAGFASNAAAIKQEAQARADADEAEANLRLALAAAVAAGDSSNSAALVTEQTTRATADSAQASASSTLSTAVGANAASLVTQAQTSSDADSAQARQVSALTASTSGNSAALVAEQDVRATQDSVQASQVSALIASTSGSSAALVAEQDVRATQNSAQALALSGMAVATGANSAGLLSEQQARVDDTSATAQQLDSMAAAAGVNAAAITAEATVRATDNSSLASQITSVSAAAAATSASLTNEISVRAGETLALASSITTLSSTVATRGAGAALNADPGLSNALAWEVYSGSAPNFVSISDGAVGKTAIRSSAAGVQSWINERFRIPVNPEKAYRAQGKLRTVSGLSSRAFLGVALFDANGSNISGDGSQWYYFASNQEPGVEWVAYSGEFGAGTAKPFPSNAKTMAPLVILSHGGGSATHEAQDLRIEDLTDVKQLTASIQTEATTRASQTGDLFAQYTVKIDTAGRVSGFGLASTAAASGTNSSEFAVRADRFYIAPPADFTQETAPAGTSGKVWYKPSTKETFRYDGAAWVAFNPIVPFTVQATPTTINGVAVPAGVYMDAAFIKDGTITSAKVGSLSADRLTAGTISAARIGAGSITATHIDSRGLSIKDASGNVILAAGSALDWSNVGGTAKPADSAGRVLDTRSVNNGPSSYAVGNHREFKSTSTVGLTTTATYCVVETIKGWNDSSGGDATQWAYVTSGEVWKRSAGNGATTWGAWVRDIDRSVFTGDLAATKNSVGQGLLSARPTGADGDFYYATDNGTLYQRISGAWTTSSTNTYVDSNGKIQGVSSGAGLSVSNNEDSVIRAPGGGVFVTNASTMTGRLKVALPQSWTNTMMRFTVEVYEYAANYMCTLEIGGYNHEPTTAWYNVTARVIGGSNVEYPIYFGHDGTKCCIWIGAATNETWSYPQVRVRDFFAGYSNYSRSQWESGWTISFDTTNIVYGKAANQYSASVLDTLPGANWSKISGTNKPADGANNTYIDASGQIQGVSAGAGIQVSNSSLVPSINNAATTATWSGVSGAGRPADGATAGSNLIKKATFTDGSMGGWGGSAVCAGCHGGASEIQTNRRDTLENGNQFVVTPGETLYAAGDIWTGGSAYGAAVGAAFLGADGNYIHWQGASKGPSQDWSRVSTPILVPAGAVTAIPWLQIDGPGGQDLPYVSFSRLYLGRQQEGATVGMSEIESSTGLTSVNGWSLNKNGSFKAVGSGNSIQVSPNAASISFTKPDGNAAFFVNESGSALFGGSLTAATGTFAGTLAAGVLDSASFDSIKYVYPNSGNYGVTVPAKKAGWASLSLKVTMVGAGGGGGGGAASGAPNRDPTSSGGGGGAGQKSVYTFNNLSSGAVIPITVGAGGAGGGANTTWNGSSVSGGSGGSGGSSGITVGSNSYYASGGTGGGAGTSALADDFGYYGNGTGGGAGGSLGGSPGSGGFRISAAGGAGGSSEFGNGGGGGSASYRSASAGGAGSIGAGGGGGGADASDAGTGYAGNGGAGGSGYILFEFYDPNTVVLNGRYSALISWLDSIGHGAVPSNAR